MGTILYVPTGAIDGRARRIGCRDGIVVDKSLNGTAEYRVDIVVGTAGVVGGHDKDRGLDGEVFRG